MYRRSFFLLLHVCLETEGCWCQRAIGVWIASAIEIHNCGQNVDIVRCPDPPLAHTARTEPP